MELKRAKGKWQMAKLPEKIVYSIYGSGIPKRWPLRFLELWIKTESISDLSLSERVCYVNITIKKKRCWGMLVAKLLVFVSWFIGRQCHMKVLKNEYEQ